MRTEMKLMIERKRLIREGTPEAEEKAEKILRYVEENGGLTTKEVLSLMAH